MMGVVSCRKKYCGFIFCVLCFFFAVVHYTVVYTQMQSAYYQKHEMVMVEGWEFNKSRNASDYVMPDEMTTIVNAEQLCADSPPVVMVVVCSNTVNFVSRLAIRKTWARDSRRLYNVSVVFLVGLSLEEDVNEGILHENLLFNDVIQENFIDTYNNLTLKTLMMLKWVKNNCQNAKYIMKADDDIYINMHNLLRLIDNIPSNSTETILVGKLLCSPEVISNPNNKWYMPRYMYPYGVYPNYLSGVGYLMSMKVALKLYNEAFHESIIHMEDVFITGICTKAVGLKPTGHFTFLYREQTRIVCDFNDRYLVIHSHQVSPNEMYLIHEKLEACKLKPTEKSFVLRWANWRALRVEDKNLDVKRYKQFPNTCHSRR